jgi:hypothetical protein
VRAMASTIQPDFADQLVASYRAPFGLTAFQVARHQNHTHHFLHTNDLFIMKFHIR